MTPDATVKLAREKYNAFRAGRTAPKAKRSETGGRGVSGYAAVFYSPRDPAGTTFQLYPGLEERIASTAFDAALARGDDAILNFNHDDQFTLARVGAGTLALQTDSVGLRYEAELRDDPQSESVLSAVRRGDVAGASFRFHVMAESYAEQSDGLVVRWVEDVELLDVSICTKGAYANANAMADSRMVTPSGRIGTRAYRYQSKAQLLAEVKRSEEICLITQKHLYRTADLDRIDRSLRALMTLRKRHNL